MRRALGESEKGSLPGSGRFFLFRFSSLRNGRARCVLFPTIVLYFCFTVRIEMPLNYGCGIRMRFAQNTEARRVAFSPASVNTTKLRCQPETNGRAEAGAGGGGGRKGGLVSSYFGPKCFLKQKTCQKSLFLERLILHR